MKKNNNKNYELEAIKQQPKKYGLQKGQKPTGWSKEDEEHIKSILTRLDGMCKKGATFTQTRFAVSEDKDWLKSLRPQPHWKPTEEQMQWLKSAVIQSTDKPVIHGTIISLYEALNRL